MKRLSLQLSTLEKIFPFSFIVDGEYKIQTAGRSIKKLIGRNVDGDHFENHLHFLKPTDFLPENLNCVLDELVQLEEKTTKAKLIGQFIKPNFSETFVFIGSLSASAVHEVTRLNLNFNDFPLQDQIFDFLMLTQTQNRTIIEAHKLNEKLKEANEIARNASEMKSQFLATMSHELRTPMNGIIGMAELMKETTELNSEQSEYVSGILDSAESLLSLINDILDLSKIESGHIELNEEEVSLNVLIEEIFSSLKALAEKRNNKLGFKIHDPTEKIVTDRRKLKQILINLVGNANKFTHSGFIQVDMFGIQDQIVKFMVTDTGIGMTLDTVEKLFNPFVQGDSAMNRQYGGTGLGLSISKKLIDSLGGAISVESRPNFGSKFTFTITNKKDRIQTDSLFSKN
tara:strand:+ start:63767 stop:64966 length:1200 start_codon:yes stop_codon:yes gene_type:complete